MPEGFAARAQKSMTGPSQIFNEKQFNHPDVIGRTLVLKAAINRAQSKRFAQFVALGMSRSVWIVRVVKRRSLRPR